MEAARVASMRGHKVSLYEKSDQLGGHLIEGSVPAFKEDVARLLKWYKTELLEMGVEIHLNKEASPEMVLKEASSAVVVATGSRYALPDIPGIDREKVISELTNNGLEYEEAGNMIQVFHLDHERVGKFETFVARPRSATLEDVFFRLTGRSLLE